MRELNCEMNSADNMKGKTVTAIREEWADVARGIAIISVMLGHMGIEAVNSVVYTYHLPVFFLLSGYFLKRKPDSVTIKEKGKSLLIPYAFTCVMLSFGSVVIGQFLGQSGKLNSFFEWVKGSLYGAGDDWTYPFTIRGIGAVWFLPALFFAVIIVNYFVEKSYMAIWIVIIAYVGWATFNVSNIWLPFSIQAGCLASLYVYLGWTGRQNRVFETAPKAVPVIMIVLLWIWAMKNFHGFWLTHNYLGNGALDIITSLCGAYIIFLLSRAISKKTNIIKKILEFYGRNSLIIMCLHTVEFKLFPWWIITDYIQNNINITGNIVTMILFVMRLLFCTLMIPVIKGIPFLKICFYPPKRNKNQVR